MKVCICSFTGYKSLNGSNLRMYFIVRELLKRKHDLRFIVPSESDAESCKERFNVDARVVGLSISRFKSSKIFLYPIFALKARKMIRDCDLVIGQSLPSALAIRMSKVKAKKVVDYVDFWSDYWLYANQGLKGRFIYKLIKWAEGYSLNVDLIFTITNKLKDKILERKGDLSKVRIVRDGVDLKMFRQFKVKDDFYKKYNLNKKDVYLTYQGGIAAHDGVQFLIKAAPLVLEKNPNVKFLIVGDGLYLNVLKKMVDEVNLNDSFIFTGWVDYNDMPFFMNISKLNLVPLPNADATNGVVTYKLFEGIACGVPTLISDLPGVNEAVKHKETACLIVAEDPQNVSNAINKMLANKELYNKIRKNGLKLIKNHDWRDIAKDVVDQL